MKSNDVLNNFKNVKKYILLLPIQEQLDEINEMINYHTNFKHPLIEVKNKYAIISQLKDFKKSLIKYHLQELCSDPLKHKETLPLYKLLQ